MHELSPEMCENVGCCWFTEGCLVEVLDGVIELKFCVSKTKKSESMVNTLPLVYMQGGVQQKMMA